MQQNWPYYIANEARSPNHDLEVTDKFTGKVVACVALADAATIASAIAAAVEAEEAMRKLPPYARQAILNHGLQPLRQFGP